MKWLIKSKEIYSVAKEWLFYSVFLSCVPQGFVWLFKWVTNCDITVPRILPEALLIGFAVATNSLGCSKEYKGKYVQRKETGERIVLFIMLFCLVFYFGLYLSPERDNVDILSVFSHPGSRPWFVLILAVFSFFIAAIIGVRIKWLQHLDSQTDISLNGKKSEEQSKI